MAGGSWNPTTSEVRAGMYINFVNAALAQINGGERGIVAMPLSTYTGTAVTKTFYTVESEKQASDLFGAANIKPITRVFKGGAKQVLAYTMPAYDAQTVTQDYIDMRDGFSARPFNVFVYPGEVTSAEQDATKTWMTSNRSIGKHFGVVFGGSAADDANPTTGNARSVRLADEEGYVWNLITGAVENGVNLSSAETAPFIAGLIAATPINRAITYTPVAFDDVTLRLSPAQIKIALQSGSLLLVHDGEKVKVERGITTAQTDTGVKKIRTARARQAMQTDLQKGAEDNFIGKIDNNVDGQKAVIASIKAYLERMAVSNVITENITVDLDPNYLTSGDSAYISIRVYEVDSLEEIYLTIYSSY